MVNRADSRRTNEQSRSLRVTIGTQIEVSNRIHRDYLRPEKPWAQIKLREIVRFGHKHVFRDLDLRFGYVTPINYYLRTLPLGTLQKLHHAATMSWSERTVGFRYLFGNHELR